MKKLVMAFMFLFFVGCVGLGAFSGVSKFYVLQTDDNIQKVGDVKTSVGVEEFRIPEYLDKPQMVTRQENGVQLDLSEFNRWSEPLSVMMQRVLAADMAFALPSSIVKSKLLNGENFKYSIFVEVINFEGTFGEEAILDAWWYIFNKSGTQLVRERFYDKVAAGDDYDSLVKAQSKLVADLAIKIVGKIKELN